MHAIKKHKTAILVFANSSQEELKNKSIAKGGNLFDMLTAQTLETDSNSKLPYFLFSEKQQLGNSFGERFTNAIQRVFAKGYEQVITIGNDSPQLKVSHILEAEKQLQAKKFVLGPSMDGGFYLMGLNKSQFEVSAFKNLAWQTSALSRQLLRLIAIGSVEIVRLQTLFDIDTMQDIKSIITHAYQLPEWLMSFLLSIIGCKEEMYKDIPLFVQRPHSKIHNNKGSPPILQS